ncbi:hypothetical protein [Klebsiella sp. BIGb0407]|uniref:hypothetical protein n=1 Tax=Klebsiella sp. BIGb0407 TaxID=2940603 RepID=UPI00216A4109|nr:hypothetical protein [Klebsiella sp. BIGb0407]MCS3434228.1 hypothetical protein [Klebsiella sp. BIGb0407]
MTTAYMDGQDLGWLLCLFFILFCAGTVIALAMFVIPQRYNLFFYRGNIFIISTLIAITGIGSLAVFRLHTFTPDELEIGRHWGNDCMLMEVNIPTGIFSDAVNKLDCAGVIINVPTQTFNLYTAQWKMYQDKNK